MSGFMAVKLEEGKNDITFSFCPKGLKPGIVLSVAGFAALALYIIFRKKITEIADKAEGLCRVGVYALLVAVLAAVYVLPLIISIIGNICSLAG